MDVGGGVEAVGGGGKVEAVGCTVSVVIGGMVVWKSQG